MIWQFRPKRGQTLGESLFSGHGEEERQNTMDDVQDALILVVDDDIYFSENMERLITRMGHRFIGTGSLKEAHTILETEDVDLILLDLFLPDGSGLDQIDLFRKRYSQPEVVVISGRGDTDAASTAIIKGALEYLVKPLQAYLDEHDELLMVSGFTDDLPIHRGNRRYQDNWGLSAQRALTVTRTLIDQGLPNDRVFAAAFGPHHPAVPNDDAEARARNRRVEISTVPRSSAAQPQTEPSPETAPAAPGQETVDGSGDG